MLFLFILEQIAQPLKNQLFKPDSHACLHWIAQTQSYQHFLHLQNKIDSGLLIHSISDIIERYQKFEEYLKQDDLDFEEVWESYMKLEHRFTELGLSSASPQLKGLDKIAFYRETLFEEICSQVSQTIEKQLTTLRERSKKENVMVGELRQIERAELPNLKTAKTMRLLAEKHKPRYNYFLQIISFLEEQIKEKIESLLKEEHTKIQTIMEKISSYQNEAPSDEVAIENLSNWIEELTKLSSTNPEWCEIGKSQASQLIEKLFSKPSNQINHITHDDFMYESNEDIEDDENDIEDDQDDIE